METEFGNLFVKGHLHARFSVAFFQFGSLPWPLNISDFQIVTQCIYFGRSKLTNCKNMHQNGL
jgi:hypothetical protein